MSFYLEALKLVLIDRISYCYMLIFMKNVCKLGFLLCWPSGQHDFYADPYLKLFVVIIITGLLRRCRDERSKIIDEEQIVRKKSVTEKRTGRIADFLGSDSEREDFELGLQKSSFKDQMARSSDSEFQTAEDSYSKWQCKEMPL